VADLHRRSLPTAVNQPKPATQSKHTNQFKTTNQLKTIGQFKAIDQFSIIDQQDNPKSREPQPARTQATRNRQAAPPNPSRDCKGAEKNRAATVRERTKQSRDCKGADKTEPRPQGSGGHPNRARIAAPYSTTVNSTCAFGSTTRWFAASKRRMNICMRSVPADSGTKSNRWPVAAPADPLSIRSSLTAA
jgi:hypothetical protein